MAKALHTTKRDETPEFCTFWDLWRPHARHTDGRGDARDAFFKHVTNGADPNDIVDGAACFLRTMKDRDREYIPLAATWLQKRAYEDLAEQERAYQSKLAERKAAAQQRFVADHSISASQALSEPRDEAMIERIRKLKADALQGLKA